MYGFLWVCLLLLFMRCCLHYFYGFLLFFVYLNSDVLLTLYLILMYVLLYHIYLFLSYGDHSPSLISFVYFFCFSYLLAYFHDTSMFGKRIHHSIYKYFKEFYCSFYYEIPYNFCLSCTCINNNLCS